MNPHSEREDSKPTDEVGSEGGSPGDLDLNHDEVLTGSESTQNAIPHETVTERDRQVTRDDRPRP
jgi:hypothetical protein